MHVTACPSHQITTTPIIFGDFICSDFADKLSHARSTDNETEKRNNGNSNLPNPYKEA